MLNIENRRIEVFIISGLLAVIPAALLSPKTTAAQAHQNSLTGIDMDAIAQVYVDVDPFDQPLATVSPADSDVNLTVVNDSDSVISYLFRNSYRYQELQPGEQVKWTALELPSQIGFQQHDGGLTRVENIRVSDDGESVTLELGSAPDFGQSITGLTISENGGIYNAG